MGRPRTRDDLTGLPVRGAFRFDFGKLRGTGVASLMLCDLDNLKLINDTLGHLAGDDALRRLSGALQAGLWPGWRAYRLGGDEFAVLATAGAEVLSAWADELLHTLKRHSTQPTTVSIGIAEVPGPNSELDEVVARADRRLYAAKRRGKAQVVSSDLPTPFEAPPFHLLERDDAAQQVLGFLQRTLVEPAVGQPATLQVQAPPGGGLSAFLQQVDLVARTLGYQTLRLCGSTLRQSQHGGSWHHALLGGELLPAGLELQTFDPGPKPLALILDTPERFDTETAAALGTLLDAAQAVIHGRAELGKERSAAVVLQPLSPGALEALLRTPQERLGPLTRQWLWMRAGGLPGLTRRWWQALSLEAALRAEESVEQMLQGSSSAWETSVARHLSRPLQWPRPTLYGRQDELQDALQRLRCSSLLTITGPPGRGKTRFAEQVLGELSDQFTRVHSVTLSGVLDLPSALARLTEVLLGRPSAAVDLPSVGRLLARQATLLLLDAPAEHHLGADVIEALLVHSPLSRIIVTAQAPLGAQQESVLALPPLAPGVVGTALHGQACAEDVAALSGWVDGEPQRLNLVGALLRLSTPAQTLRHLSEHALPEHVGAALLDEHERRVLAALSSAGGPVDLTWAGHLSGASPFLLGALRDQALLQALGGGLYRLTSGVVRGAGRKWASSPALRREVRRRATRQLKAVCAAQPEGSLAWFTHLDQQDPSLRSVVAGLLQERAPLTAGLADTLVRLLPYRVARGQLHDARAELDLALQRGAALDPDELHPLRLALAQIYQHLGDHPAAQAVLDGLPRQGRRQVQAALVEARLLHRRSLYERSHALFAEVGAQAGLAPEFAVKALDGQARSAIYLGRLAEAQAWSDRALTLAQGCGDLLLSDLLNTAALIATEQRDLERAEHFFHRALDIHRTFGHHAGLTLNLTGLAWATLLRGEPARSAELSREVLRLAQDAGHAWEIANALINLGHALARSGELAQARAAQLRGGRLALQNDAPSLVAEAVGGLAEVLCREGQLPRARTVLKVALTHSGANAELRRFFAGLTERLEPMTASLGPLDTAEFLLTQGSVP